MGEERAQPIPSNHRQAERHLISLVLSGEWEVDVDGRVWRLALRHGRKDGGMMISPVARRRVDRRLPTGYMMIGATIDGVRIIGLAHRLVWQRFHGDIPDGLIINHKNGRRGDNRPENLEVVTYSENALHAHANLNPTVLRGARNGGSKLTESDVIDMRNERAGGAALLVLAAKYGISFQQVSTITKGRRWAHVRGAPLSTDDGRLVCSQDRSGATGRFVSRKAG